MKQSSALGFFLIAGVAACGAAWALLPSLQSPMQKVESEAATSLERARRLLHQYDPRLPFQASVVDQLGQAGVASDDPSELSDAALDDYQQVHERLWTAFQPMQWGDHPSPARANYGSVEQQIRSGVSDRAGLLRENEQLLREADSAVDEALSASAGSASGRDLAETHRMKSTILYFTGMADSVRASFAREQAGPHLSKLLSLVEEAIVIEDTSELATASGIAEGIEQAGEELRKAQVAVEAQQRALDGLDRSIADLSQRINALTAERDSAKKEMDALRERGIDFSQNAPVSSFAEGYFQADRRYRAAHRQIQFLTTGYFPNAEIDATGDYLTGRYVENGSAFNLTTEKGLNYLQSERTVTTKKLVELERSLASWRDVLGRLEEMRSTFDRNRSTSQTRLTALRDEVLDVLDRMDESDAAALELEDKALASFDRSLRSARDASTAAGQWVSDAQQKTQSLPMQSQERSAFKPRTDDRWIGAFALAQSADARLARGWIYYNRYVAAKERVATLERARLPLHLTDDDIALAQEAADAARDAGVEEIKQAMADLERAHRDAEGNWTLVAQAGSTQYLLALFGDSSYAADTIAAYRKAIENREGTPAAQPFVARLRTLEARR